MRCTIFSALQAGCHLIYRDIQAYLEASHRGYQQNSDACFYLYMNPFEMFCYSSQQVLLYHYQDSN